MKIRAQTWLALIVGAVGLLFAAILGIWTFASATATPLHPNPQEVPSVTRAAPLPKWADAVEQGRQIVRAGLIEQNLPGLSVAVGVGSDIVWAEGFGWADLENRVPVAPEMRFRIGTASTALTSAAVGLLLEQGRLNLDDEIQIYVPAFPKKQWPVTLRQLMGHLAGVRNDGGDEGPLLSARCERPVEGLQPFAERSLLFEPGTQYRYSSYGWILVSAAVEAAAHEPFLTFMRKQIYAPLGMDDTRADVRDGADPGSGDVLLSEVRGGSPLRPAPDAPDRLFLLRGIQRIPVHPSDLVRFAMATNSGKLLQPATVQLLQTSQRLASGQETGYGLGWDLETVTLAGKETRLVGHDGESLGGMVASFMTFPDSGIVVSVTSNISYADTYALAVKIAQAFAEQAKSPARQ